MLVSLPLSSLRKTIAWREFFMGTIYFPLFWQDIFCVNKKCFFSAPPNVSVIYGGEIVFNFLLSGKILFDKKIFFARKVVVLV